MDTAFASLMVEPPTVRCIGVDMRPFSLGHYLILSHEQSPFIVGNMPDFDDLVFAAFVCAHDWRSNMKLRKSPLRRWIIARIWGLFTRRFDGANNMVRMAFHIRDAQTLPESKPQKGTTRRFLFSDWPTRLLEYLLSRGFTIDQALDLPLVQANRLFVAHLETSGEAEFMVERDDAATRALTRVVEEAEEKERALSA
jgi:hypothetical protein